MTTPLAIVWLRDDLRIADNPALHHAIDAGAQVVVVYLLDEESRGVRPVGAAGRWWLHHSLAALAESLAARGGQLVLRRGEASREIPLLIEETGATAVYWNRRYTAARDIDADLMHSLRERGTEVRSFHANLLFEPWTVRTAEGNPYRVFTPFWRSCLDKGVPRAPLEAPTSIPSRRVESDELDDWRLLPTKPDWSAGLRKRWTPGEESGQRARWRPSRPAVSPITTAGTSRRWTPHRS